MVLMCGILLQTGAHCLEHVTIGQSISITIRLYIADLPKVKTNLKALQNDV